MDPKTFWNAPYGSAELWIKIAVATAISIGLIFGLRATPPPLRRPIVTGITFLSGLFYVLLWLYPTPINRVPDEAPRNAFEGFGFLLADAQPRVANFTNVIAGALIGLGIYSLLSIHLKRFVRRGRDWQFSAVLIVSLFAMAFFGYADYYQRTRPEGGRLPYVVDSTWGWAQYGTDFLFDGLLQQMDAAMFSVVAFYILSAAYRAFRARSVEATILLIAALVVMLSFMGLAESAWNGVVADPKNPAALSNSFTLAEIAKWLKDNVQTPSIRGIDFGVGVGLMAMGLRLWLSLERLGDER